MEKAGLRFAGARHWEQRGLDVVWYSSAVAADGPSGSPS
jgi:hypothetical protein